MASGIYQNYIKALSRGQVDYTTDVFKVALVTSAYTPNFDTHANMDDITDEVVGTGYTAGGEATTITEVDDAVNDRVDYEVANVEWPVSTLTARAGILYVEKGTAAQDLLVAYVDFGSDKSTVAGTFEFAATSPLRFQR